MKYFDGKMKILMRIAIAVIVVFCILLVAQIVYFSVFASLSLETINEHTVAILYGISTMFIIMDSLIAAIAIAFVIVILVGHNLDKKREKQKVEKE